MIRSHPLHRAARWPAVVVAAALCLSLVSAEPVRRVVPAAAAPAGLLGAGTVGPAGGTVTFRGGALSVPAGALPTPTPVRVSAVSALPYTPLNAYARYLMPAVRVDMAGVVPTRDLQVRLAVDPADVAGADPFGVFIAAVPAEPVTPFLLLSSGYEPAVHVLSADTAQAGVFAAAVVDLDKLGSFLGDLVAKHLLGARLSRPGCVGQDVTLLDGSVVSIGRASWQSGTDPPIYACVRESVDDEHVVVQINNNRPNSFSFRVPAGFRATQLGIPTSAVMTQIIAYDIATKVQGVDKQYLTSTATVAVEVPVGALDTRIAVEPDPLLAWLGAIAVALPLIVQAVIAGGGFLLFGPAGLAAAALIDAALSSVSLIDCLTEAANKVIAASATGPPPLTELPGTAFDLVVGCISGPLGRSLRALRGLTPKVVGLVTGEADASMPIDVVRTRPPAPTHSPTPSPSASAGSGGTPPPAIRPGVGLDISSGPPGSIVTATGGGYHPNQPIMVSQAGPGGTGPVGTVTADSAGNFEMTFRIGDGTPPGRITITFHQAPDITVTDTFDVTT